MQSSLLYLPLASSATALFVNQVFFSCAFQNHQPSSPKKKLLMINHHPHYKTRLYSISNSNDNNKHDNSEEEEDNTNNNIFAALPPIGASSFWDRQDDEDTTDNDNNAATTSLNIVVSRKFRLSYTCKICETHNTHSITRLGYNHGVVIAVCKCCQSKHLIADNLGWSNSLVNGFDYEGGERNIEAYVKNRQEENDNGGGSLRVDRGVFDLESLWHEEKDSSGSVLNEAVVVEKDGEHWN